METKIDWRNFDWVKFQQLCNCLLLHEVSKKVKVFDKQGKDGGVDASYVGNYDGDSGKWRFQAKFHEDFHVGGESKLRRDIKDDLHAHLKDEDFIVYLTNLEFLPQVEQRLVAEAEGVILAASKGAKVFIWHGATLQAMLHHHPVLVKGFWHNHGAMFQHHRDRFAKQLRLDNATPFSFANRFCGREDELVQLGQFLEDENETVCTIVAPGGHGKTRLCIDFFQRMEQEDNEWHFLVLVKNVFNVEGFDYCLSGKDKLAVLLDDAHLESNLQTIIEVVSRPQLKGRIKLFLTLRNSLVSEVKSKGSSHDGLGTEIILSRLTTSDAEQMILPEVLSYWQRRLERELLSIDQYPVSIMVGEIEHASKGVPLVINTYLHALSQADARGERFTVKNVKFEDLVWRYVDEDLRFAAHQLHCNMQDLKGTLRLLALVTPFYVEDFERIQAQTKISEGEFVRLIELMVNVGLIEKRDQNDIWFGFPVDDRLEWKRPIPEIKMVYSLIPDPYRDVIVAEFLNERKQIHQLISGEFGRHFLSRMLDNISTSKEAKAEGTGVWRDTMRHFALKIGDPETPIDSVLFILDGMPVTFQDKDNTVVSAAIQEVMKIMDPSHNDPRRSKWEEIEYRQQWLALIAKTESLLERYIVRDEIDPRGFSILLLFCRVTGKWSLYRTSTKDKLVLGKGISYHNSDFLVQRAMEVLVNEQVNVDFGLRFLGWALGIYHDAAFPNHLDYHGDFPLSPFRTIGDVPVMRRQVLQFLYAFGKHHREFADLVLEMLIHLMVHSRRCWQEGYDVERSPKLAVALENCRALAVQEIDMVYRWILGMVRIEERDTHYKHKLWNRIQEFVWHSRQDEFKSRYSELQTLVAEPSSLGEAIVLQILREDSLRVDWDDSKVDALLGQIQSVDAAIGVIKVFFETMPKLDSRGIQNLSGRSSYIFWNICRLSPISVEEFYDQLLHTYPELLAQSHGCVLNWLGFGERRNRGFYSSKINWLLEQGTAYHITEIVLSFPNGWSNESHLQLEPQDKNTVEQVVAWIEHHGPSFGTDPGTVLIQTYMGNLLRDYIQLDLQWLEGMYRRCYPHFSDGYRWRLMGSLLWWGEERGDSVAFLRPWILEVGVQWPDQDPSGRYEELLAYAFRDLPFEQVFEFFLQHLKYRYCQKAMLQHAHTFFLLLDPHDRYAGSPRKEVYQSTDPQGDFRFVLDWFFGFDMHREGCYLDDAWHLLRYFRAKGLGIVDAAPILRSAFTQHRLQNEIHFKAFLAILLFGLEDPLMDLLIAEWKMPLRPIPDSSLLASLAHGDPNTITPVQRVYQHFLDHPPYADERLKAFVEGLGGAFALAR